MTEELPLAGKRWVWILLGLLVIIVLGVIVGSRGRAYREPAYQESEGATEDLRADVHNPPYEQPAITPQPAENPGGSSPNSAPHQ